MYRADSQAKSRRSPGQYFAEFLSHQWFQVGAEDSYLQQSGFPISEVVWQTGATHKSNIVVTVTADDMRFVTNVNSGRIVRAEVASFLQNSQEGGINATIVNTSHCRNGTHCSAMFTLTADCYGSGPWFQPLQSVISIPGQTVVSTWLPLQLSVQIESDSLIFSCAVMLIDALGNTIDTYVTEEFSVVQRSVVAPQSTGNPDQRRSSLVNDNGNSKFRMFSLCDDVCPMLQFECYWAFSCWGMLGGTILAALLLLCVSCMLKSHIFRCLITVCRRSASCTAQDFGHQLNKTGMLNFVYYNADLSSTEFGLFKGSERPFSLRGILDSGAFVIPSQFAFQVRKCQYCFPYSADSCSPSLQPVNAAECDQSRLY
jgi:hypothetical protein